MGIDPKMGTFPLIPDWEHAMRLAGKALLWRFIARADGDKANDVRSWVAEVEAAEWSGSADVVDQFPAAKSRQNNDWRFPLVRSGVVIDVKILFRTAQVIVGSVR